MIINKLLLMNKIEYVLIPFPSHGDDIREIANTVLNQNYELNINGPKIHLDKKFSLNY
jgi:hypothetical protein